MGKVILHIPHSSKVIPDYIRKDILLTDSELKEEMELITDLYTDLIFTGKDVVKFEFSRFVCDVERFEDDKLESMAKLGMGTVYIKTSTGKELRKYDIEKRQYIIGNYYRPHHEKFEMMVKEKLEKYNECLIIDCHSFNESTSYIDMVGAPDICLGVDTYHTPIEVVDVIRKAFESYGYIVEINKPFLGSIVPLKYYGKDKSVKSIMIELNKRIYTKNGIDTDEKGIQKISDVCKEIINLLGV